MQKIGNVYLSVYSLLLSSREHDTARVLLTRQKRTFEQWLKFNIRKFNYGIEFKHNSRKNMGIVFYLKLAFAFGAKGMSRKYVGYYGKE